MKKSGKEGEKEDLPRGKLREIKVGRSRGKDDRRGEKGGSAIYIKGGSARRLESDVRKPMSEDRG